jgi:hypothetical protein
VAVSAQFDKPLSIVQIVLSQHVFIVDVIFIVAYQVDIRLGILWSRLLDESQVTEKHHEVENRAARDDLPDVQVL